MFPLISRHKPFQHRVHFRRYIIPGREDHERENECKADLKTNLLHPLPERTTPQCFSGIEQQVSPVKDGDRKEVDQAQIDRQKGHKIDQVERAALLPNLRG